MTGKAKNEPKKDGKTAEHAFTFDMKARTVSGVLAFGVDVDGQAQREFTLRLPTVGDEIEAAESEVPGFNVMLMSLCLLSLGSVPKDKITYELLLGLDSDDFVLLGLAREALKKKRKEWSVNTVISGSPASGSVSTDTQTAKSETPTL